jgi:hypothetical protein
MWYFILLLLSPLVGCANRYSERFLQCRTGALRMSSWSQGCSDPNSLGTTGLARQMDFGGREVFDDR